MKPKKKSKVFAFICSFVPGAEEMYLGFMKMGFSLMLIFMLCLLVPAMFGASDYFLVFGVLVWAYGFFHARNIAALNDEEFGQFEDRYIWEEFTEESLKLPTERFARRWGAAILILVGIGVLWSNFRGMILTWIPDRLWDYVYSVVNVIPSTIIAILIILLGIRLIRGKKRSEQEEENHGEN